MFSPIQVCLNCATDTTGTKMYGRRFCGRPCWSLWLRRPAQIEGRFWVKVQKTDGDACWTWLGARSSVSRYGTFNYQGHNINAHRAAWLLTHGPIEGKDIDVLHRCNNGHLGCVRPSHLYLGSASQNMIDKIAAGRDPRAWLNAEQVRAIREALKKPYHGIQQDLARQYGVPHGCISKLHVGKIYAWVK